MAANHALIHPHSYQDAGDLARMQVLLVEGRQAANRSFYIHPGDLGWWLYYLPHEAEARQNIFLWEDDKHPGRLVAWTLLSPAWQAFDVFVAPAWHGSPLAEEIYAWSEARLVEALRSCGGKKVQSMWIAEGDPWLEPWFNRRGYLRSGSSMIQLERALSDSIPAAILPSGYRLRTVSGEGDCERRARVQYAAFGSSLPYENYCQRYLRFMRSPVYQLQHDLVIEAPDGALVAFCIVWTDETNRVGLFEPVGVHPDYQRKGLGKAILFEGLSRLPGAGMKTAIVNAENDNHPAQRLYESTGFRAVQRFATFTKEITLEAG